MKKVVITARINEDAGRDENPHVPWSPAEIARDAAACREAGAAIVHWHGRDGATGAAAHSAALDGQIIRQIREQSDILTSPTLGYTAVAQSGDRIRPFLELACDPATRPDIGPVDMASVNVDRYDPGCRAYTTEDVVFRNPTHELIQFTRKIRGAGIRTIHACWNLGSLRAIGTFLEMGLIADPAYILFLLSDDRLPAAHPPTVRGLLAYLDFLPAGHRIEWSVGCYPGSLLPVAAAAIAAGGHIMVGLGDDAYRELGTPNNAAVVAHFAALVRSLGREIATPQDAREILGMS
jgi:uncharacterized protein (DUF849 family)